MGKAKKSFEINIVRVCDDETSVEIIRQIAKNEIKRYLDSQGVVSYNLDEVLSKYITGDMLYDKRG